MKATRKACETEARSLDVGQVFKDTIQSRWCPMPPNSCESGYLYAVIARKQHTTRELHGFTRVATTHYYRDFSAYWSRTVVHVGNLGQDSPAVWETCAQVQDRPRH